MHTPTTQPVPPVQTTGSPPTQAPAWQVSVWVQASPSLHGVPAATGVFVGTPLSQTSSVHGFWSSTGTQAEPPALPLLLLPLLLLSLVLPLLLSLFAAGPGAILPQPPAMLQSTTIQIDHEYPVSFPIVRGRLLLPLPRCQRNNLSGVEGRA
jgi:hypothetical protein